MFGRATIRLGIGPHSSFVSEFSGRVGHWLGLETVDYIYEKSLNSTEL